MYDGECEQYAPNPQFPPKKNMGLPKKATVSFQHLISPDRVSVEGFSGLWSVK